MAPRRPRPRASSSPQARADGLKDQFIMDVHTHFLRDDTRLEGFVRGRGKPLARPAGTPSWPASRRRSDDLKYPNWFKEVYLDSDTKVALISGSPSEDPRDWFLTNDMKLDARTRVNNGGGLTPLSLARHLHAGLSGLDGRGRSRHRQRSSPIRGRATPSATTPTRICRPIPGAWTTRSWSIPSTRSL